MEARQAAAARQEVTVLYHAHALGLVRLAVLMVGDQLTAEDVVQDAFLGLYRRWSALQDQEKALSYVRASVVSGCRMIYRVKYRRDRVFREDPGQAESAEATAMLGEAHREVQRASPTSDAHVNISRQSFLRYIDVKEAAMTKTLIEIDDEYLRAAQQALGTATKKDTVNAALREVTALAARRRDLQRLTSGGLPDLEDEDVMRAAWQR
jgi:Arc/MetJ family transcription regulator